MSHANLHTPPGSEAEQSSGELPAQPFPTEDSLVGRRVVSPPPAPSDAKRTPLEVAAQGAVVLMGTGVVVSIAGSVAFFAGMNGVHFGAPTGMVAMAVGMMLAAAGFGALLALQAIDGLLTHA